MLTQGLKRMGIICRSWGMLHSGFWGHLKRNLKVELLFGAFDRVRRQ